MIKKPRREAQRLKFIPGLLLFIETGGDSGLSSALGIHHGIHYVPVVGRKEIL